MKHHLNYLAAVLAFLLVLLVVGLARAEDTVAELEVDPIDHNAEDMIGMQIKMAEVVAPPLSADELQTVREAMWKREAEQLQRDPEHIQEPGMFMQIAFAHLLAGKPLRRGDVIALHGALLSAQQTNTLELAKRWRNAVLHPEPTS